MLGSYIGAIDHGTTGTRFMAFDHGGSVVTSAYRRHEQIRPEPGWLEHDPVEIWEATQAVVTRGLSKAGIEPTQLATLGIANQRETAVVWEAGTGQPVHNAVVWRDRRTADRAAELAASEIAGRVRERTGLTCDGYFSATKFEWLLDNADRIEPHRSGGRSLRSRVAAGELLVGTLDSWLLYKLTGNHRTDVTNAARTMLYDIHEMDWDPELLAEFDIPRAALPEVRPSSDRSYGSTDPNGFLGAEVPVTGVLGDQQAALVGQACFDPGDAKSTYGTGSFYLMNTGEEAVESEHGLLTTVGFQRSGEPPQYALEGSIFFSGGAVEWLDEVGLLSEPTQTATLAREAESNRGVYLVPALAGLGGPHWDRNARGTILGLTRGTEQKHIVRAALESIAYQTRDIAEAMAADTGVETTTLRVDGGAVRNNFLCQLQADILKRKLVRPQVDETTALGAAYAAGLAVGYWETLEQLRGHWCVDRAFEPELPADEADRMYSRWGDAVERSLDWAE